MFSVDGAKLFYFTSKVCTSDYYVACPTSHHNMAMNDASFIFFIRELSRQTFNLSIYTVENKISFLLVKQQN